MTKLISPPCRASPGAIQWNEDRHARLRPDLARDVALAGAVFGDQNVAATEPTHGAIADFDVDSAGEREDRVPARRVVPGIGALGLEAAHDDAAARNQLRALRLITERIELRLDVLEVGLAVGTGVDADDPHVAPLLLTHVADKSGRRILAPLAAEALLHRQEIAATLRVQPVGVRPALVDAPPWIGPVVVDLTAEQVPPHAPHVLVLAEPHQIFVILEHRVHVGPLERHVIEPGALVTYAEQRVVIDVLVAAITAVERADDVVLVARVDVVGADEAERLAKPLHGLLDLWRRSEEHTSELQSHSDLVC